MTPANPPVRYFAVAAPGLHALLAAEMRQLGLIPATSEGESGGVGFNGGLGELYTANLRLRTASRVLVRLGGFHAASFSELVARAARLEWERYLQPGQPFHISVTCHKSRLYHSSAVAERVAAAIGTRLGAPSPLTRATDEEAERPAQLILARLLNDQVTLSLDSSGALLHRRGYRLETAKAPLRETLAAALLLASGWDRSSPLLDPFCGSGTIAIEAARMALGIPPGAQRSFAFMDWPGFQPQLWGEILSAAAVPEPLASIPAIQASDRDAGAIRIAQANAERAGVAARDRVQPAGGLGCAAASGAGLGGHQPTLWQTHQPGQRPARPVRPVRPRPAPQLPRLACGRIEQRPAPARPARIGTGYLIQDCERGDVGASGDWGSVSIETRTTQWS